MKTIASANYWQKKQWDMVQLMREVEEERSRLTPEEKAERDRFVRESHARYMEKAERVLAERRKVPSPARRWLFERKAKQSIAVARYFEMNMKAECNDDIGIISFLADEILSDMIWSGDHVNRRRMLNLLKRASSIAVDIAEEGDLRTLRISLYYSLSRVITKKKGVKVSSPADSCPE